MGKYATISVPVEVKKCLEIMKGNKTWGEFLTEMANETQTLLKARKTLGNFHELQNLGKIYFPVKSDLFHLIEKAAVFSCVACGSSLFYHIE